MKKTFTEWAYWLLTNKKILKDFNAVSYCLKGIESLPDEVIYSNRKMTYEEFCKIPTSGKLKKPKKDPKKDPKKAPSQYRRVYPG